MGSDELAQNFFCSARKGFVVAGSTMVRGPFVILAFVTMVRKGLFD